MRKGRAHEKMGRKKMLAVVMGAAILASMGLFGFIYSGITSVAVTEPHFKPVEWVLRTTMERAIKLQAADIQVPTGTDLQDRALAEKAIGHYSAACAMCHAAPGESRAPWMVVYPEPPELTRPEIVSKWSDAELYWIVKNGIKHTAMIALGPTHKEEDLWAVAAFVRQLPAMSPEEYGEMVEMYRTQPQTNSTTSHEHDHEEGHKAQYSK